MIEECRQEVIEKWGEEVAACLAQYIQAQKLIGRYYKRLCILFDCSIEIFCNLGKMYVEDDRFVAYFRKFHTDLPAFMRDSTAVCCDRKP